MCERSPVSGSLKSGSVMAFSWRRSATALSNRLLPLPESLHTHREAIKTLKLENESSTQTGDVILAHQSTQNDETLRNFTQHLMAHCYCTHNHNASATLSEKEYRNNCKYAREKFRRKCEETWCPNARVLRGDVRTLLGDCLHVVNGC